MILNNKIPLEYLTRMVWLEATISIATSTVILILKRFTPLDILLPVALPAFLGTSISLILAFKMNQSYDRWWEARKIWGEIVNDSRALILQLQTYLVMGHKSESYTKSFANRQIAWCVALTAHLRNQTPYISKDLLQREEWKSLHYDKNIPLTILNFHYDQLKKIKQEGLINDFHEIRLEETLHRLIENQGKLERIKLTVFPIIYRLFLKYSLSLFIITLAVSLSNLNLLTEILILIVIALPFHMLEKSAFYLQDPFENRESDVPMTHISKTIEQNIRNIMDKDRPASRIQSNDFYIL